MLKGGILLLGSTGCGVLKVRGRVSGSCEVFDDVHACMIDGCKVSTDATYIRVRASLTSAGASLKMARPVGRNIIRILPAHF